MTYSWSSAASAHTANDGTSQSKNGSKRAHNQNGQEATLDDLDVIAVVYYEGKISKKDFTNWNVFLWSTIYFVKCLNHMRKVDNNKRKK